MNLWKTEGMEIDEVVHRLTVGEDIHLDKIIAEFDVYGSIAQAYMLKEMGEISPKSYQQIKLALLEVLQLIHDGKFEIKVEQEDCHTVIEQYLTNRVGAAGQDIHTFRSRNDQVLVATRLYSKARLIQQGILSVQLGETLHDIAKKYEHIPMVGLTHTRPAMPSSVGLYFGAYFAELLENLGGFIEKIGRIDICPLGSGTGYGSPADVKRQLTSDLLGFRGVQINSLHCQNSRGPIEAGISEALLDHHQNLGKLANELVLYSEPHFGYFTIPDKFTTGSSAMPQKKNPDCLELIRGYEAYILGYAVMLRALSSKLLSGYNRDAQLTKEPLMRGLRIESDCTLVMNRILAELGINTERIEEDCPKYRQIYATLEALSLREEAGISYRRAYQMVKNGEVPLRERDPVEELNRSTHIGGTGNLQLEQHKEQLDAYRDVFEGYRARFDQMVKGLLALK